MSNSSLKNSFSSRTASTKKFLNRTVLGDAYDGLYHVRQIAYDMSLRVQRSGAFAERLVEKQSQGLCDCFTSFAIDLCSTGHDIIWHRFSKTSILWMQHAVWAHS
ncbi:hypothetical protein [Nostoc favosum]|uniref:Uncharacterized protein n=1 Tax=Nostoc favosum CHAB5714 TaxID=2780399 RepID=A0ABS8IB14_9NOSO|nr:hypothetical protein [Nostoc favosum]MCC5600958.1 hypothetical protein [Nostoc favosum CHAB5714]